MQYVSGIGLDESEALKAAAKDYPLALTFAAQVGGKADYVADVTVAIHDGQGKPVLRATSEGPYMLVKLPAGDYKVSATYKGQTQERQVAVRAPAPHAPSSSGNDAAPAAAEAPGRRGSDAGEQDGDGEGWRW